MWESLFQWMEHMADLFFDLRLSDLQFFVRLAALGSLTATARELRLPKATASRRLAQLEERVGVSLVKRTTRSLSLTPRGEALLRRAQQLLAVAQEAQLELLSELPAGVVRISVPVPLGRMMAGSVIAGFRRRLPTVELEIRLENDRVDLVGDNVDLAIRGGPLLDSELHARRLTSASLLRYCSAALRDEALSNVPFVAAPGDTALLRRAGLAHGPVVVTVDDRIAIADALTWGRCAGLLPSFLGEPRAADGALVCRDATPVVELPVHAVYHRSQRDDVRLMVLIEEIERNLTTLIETRS